MDIEKIAPKSGLLTPELEEQLRGVLGKLTEEAQIACVVDLSDKSSVEMAELVRHIAGMSDKLTCQFYEPQEAETLLPEIDCSLLPVTAVLRQGQYMGIAFHGVTGGKELNSFVLALYNVAGPGQEMDKRLQKKLGKLAQKTELKIFVSLSCHHCANQVIICQQMAAHAASIEAKMIDARLYPQVVEQYKIERIPMTVINDREVVMGVKTVEEMYELIKSIQ